MNNDNKTLPSFAILDFQALQELQFSQRKFYQNSKGYSFITSVSIRLFPGDGEDIFLEDNLEKAG